MPSEAAVAAPTARTADFRAFVRDNATVLAADVLVYGKALVLMPIVIQTAGVDVYGAFSLVVSIAGITYGVSALGVGYNAQRFLPAAPSREARAALFYPQYSFSLAAVLAAAALLALATGLISRTFLDPSTPLSWWAIPAYLIAYLHYSQALKYYRFTGRILKMTIANLIFTYLHIALILGFHYRIGPVTVDALVLALAATAAALGVPMFIDVVRELGTTPRFYAVRDLKDDVNKGMPLVLGTIVDFFLAASDRFLLAIYLTAAAVGSYVSGYVLGATILFVPKAIGTVLPQLMSRAHDDGRPGDARLLAAYGVKGYMLVAIPFVAGATLLGRTALHVFASPAVAAEAFWVVPIVAAGNVLYGLIMLQSITLFVHGRTATMFRVYATAAAVNVAANAVLLYFIPNILVAAVTTIVGYLIGYVSLRRSLPTAAFLFGMTASAWTRAVISTAIMTGAVLGAQMVWPLEPSWASLGLYGAIGVMAYAACILLLDVITPRERAFLRHAFITRSIGTATSR